MKKIIYNLLASKFFNQLIKYFSYPFIRMEKFENKNLQKKIIITLDCESGYLKNNNERVWMFQDPSAFQGYYYGIKNILDLLI